MHGAARLGVPECRTRCVVLCPYAFGVLLVGMNDSRYPGMSGGLRVVCSGTNVFAQPHGVCGARPRPSAQCPGGSCDEDNFSPSRLQQKEPRARRGRRAEGTPRGLLQARTRRSEPVRGRRLEQKKEGFSPLLPTHPGRQILNGLGLGPPAPGQRGQFAWVWRDPAAERKELWSHQPIPQAAVAVPSCL